MKNKRSMLVIGIVTFVIAGIVPLLKSDVAVAKEPTDERCGICVTPEGNWPYPDPASDLFASGCRPC
ncbi:MAG: hypothetical protein HBSIN02_24430 [Bacteroidia bacterium]|nr:MAG: hypothetical protein HBSIN02_24430 [Bacteroidia bacterium]